MSLEELLKKNKNRILKIAQKYGAKNIRVFGSVARRQATASSDIDLLVDMEPDRSLMDMGGFLSEAQKLLGCRVDVFTEKMLRKRIRTTVLKEAAKL